MTKEKQEAERLYNKMYFICMEYTEEIQCGLQAQRCSIISCEEIIKELSEVEANTIHEQNYWQNVISELRKM